MKMTTAFAGLFLLAGGFGLQAAESATANYNQYEVFGDLGSSFLRKPTRPQLEGGAGFGYKFAPNYSKYIVDEVTVRDQYTRRGTNDVRFGAVRNMIKSRERLGITAAVETGFSRFEHTGVTRPLIAGGLGLAMDLNGKPYGALLSNTSVSVGPEFNKTAGLPMYVSLNVRVSKSFGRRAVRKVSGGYDQHVSAGLTLAPRG